MGNAIAKNFDLPKDHGATAGHLGLWKIYSATKKTTGEKVSLWTMQKEELAKRQPAITDRTLAEQIFQIMRKDMMTLKDLDCGGFIKVLEIIEETKYALAFTTEPIVCSIEDVLNRFENVVDGKELHSAYFDQNGAFSEMEISRGLMTLAESLQYLHTVQRRIHMNVTPSSIVFTPDGQWKLCGLGFSIEYQEEEQRAASPYFLKVQSNSHIAAVEPDLCFGAPELTVGGLNHSDIRFLNGSVDVFSLGSTFYEVYLFNLSTGPQGRMHTRLIQVQNNNVSQHPNALNNLSSIDLSAIPDAVTPLLIGMLQPIAATRITANDVVNHPYFVTGSLAVLRSVDTLAIRDAGTQSSLLLSLPRQLEGFPIRILESTVLPAVSNVCLQNPGLWVFALPLHVYLSGRLPLERYQGIASPFIATGLAVTNPSETMMAFLKHVLFIQERFPPPFYAEHASVLFFNALDKQSVALQCAALQTLCDKRVYENIPQSFFIDKIVPKACREACKNPEPTVKVSALYFLSFAVTRLDKDFLAKNLVPSLKYITEHDTNAAVTMCVIGTFQAMTPVLGNDLVACSVLPVILPLLTHKTLAPQQFTMIVALTKSLLSEILNSRANELGLPPVDLGEVTSMAPGSGSSTYNYDPFTAAKDMIAQATAAREREMKATASGNRTPTGIVGSGSNNFSDSSNPTGGFGGMDVPPPPPSAPAPSMMPPPPPSAPPPSTAPAVPGRVPSKPSPSLPSSAYAGGPKAVSTTNANGSSIQDSNSWYSAAASAVGSVFVLPTGEASGGSARPAQSSATPPVAKVIGVNNSPPVPSSSYGAPSPPTRAANAPTPATAASSSGFSWMQSSGSTGSTGSGVPPPPPASIAPGLGSGSTSGQTSIWGTDEPDINVDDFLSSFNKSSSGGGMNANAGGSGFGTMNLTTTSGINSSSSIEQQIAQTQAEISRLSSGSSTPNSTAISPVPAVPAINKPPHAKPAYSGAKYSGGSTWHGTAVSAANSSTPPLGAASTGVNSNIQMLPRYGNNASNNGNGSNSTMGYNNSSNMGYNNSGNGGNITMGYNSGNGGNSTMGYNNSGSGSNSTMGYNNNMGYNSGNGGNSTMGYNNSGSGSNSTMAYNNNMGYNNSSNMGYSNSGSGSNSTMGYNNSGNMGYNNSGNGGNSTMGYNNSSNMGNNNSGNTNATNYGGYGASSYGNSANIGQPVATSTGYKPPVVGIPSNSYSNASSYNNPYNQNNRNNQNPKSSDPFDLLN